VIFPIGRRVLLFTEITVSTSATAAGVTIKDLQESGAAKILAWSRAGSSHWEWGHDAHQLAANDRLAVVATRAGLARLLRATRAAEPAAGGLPARQPAQTRVSPGKVR
jgi:Trk K+ transport system NAD-binding subunit